MRARLAFVIAIGASIFVGCSHPAPDASPDGAVRAWLDRMEATDDDPRALREAYALLGPTARGNLDERAKRASFVEGHRVDSWDMLAEGRFGLKFRPKTMVARVKGDDATVEVTGDEPSERALVKCVRDEGPPPGWRVEPDLPAVPPLPQRDPDPLPPRDDRR